MSYVLEIQLAESGELRDVLLDGDSVWPTWFKVEWKGNGQLSAKVAGNRLSTRDGDEIRFILERAANDADPAREKAAEPSA